MAATKEGIEKFKKNALLEMFGTTDILEILGPAGTIPPLISLAERLKDHWHMHPTCVSRWCKSHIPEDLYEVLKSYQKSFEASRRASTNIAKYGHPNPFGSDIVKNQIAEKKESIYAARHKTCVEKYGGASRSLSPDVILERLKLHDLEPIDPITGNSDVNKSIPVRCALCGYEFTTHWITGNNRNYAGRGFTVCPCQSRNSKFQKHVSEYIESLGYSVKSIRPDWMPSRISSRKCDNLEIDCFIPELNIGFEINGYYSHTTEPNALGTTHKPKDFHEYKSDCCAANGVKLYHIWHNSNTSQEQEAAEAFIRAVLHGEIPEMDENGCIDRDILPNPEIVGLPYVNLGPQPKETPYGICYTSGLWKFYSSSL